MRLLPSRQSGHGHDHDIRPLDIDQVMETLTRMTDAHELLWRPLADSWILKWSEDATIHLDKDRLRIFSGPDILPISPDTSRVKALHLLATERHQERCARMLEWVEAGTRAGIIEWEANGWALSMKAREHGAGHVELVWDMRWHLAMAEGFHRIAITRGLGIRRGRALLRMARRQVRAGQGSQVQPGIDELQAVEASAAMEAEGLAERAVGHQQVLASMAAGDVRRA